jgi:predicted Ser/Thr protein kinase/Tfp pilus assembly protein PilF
VGGRIAGRYDLEVELARGGMGVVYRGRDRNLGQLVAIKVMLPDARTDSELVKRFKREALAMGRVEHPNLVRVRDAGVDFGRPYLVMDLVEGETLRQALRRQRFAPREAAKLVRQLAEALHAVHEEGVLHRDVKPENVLLDSDRRPYLTDFGVGKLMDESRGTATGTILGSPAYISPEQANGEFEQLGPPSDVYGLGATFYTLLTGRAPFTGKSVVSILHKVLTEAPRPVRELAPDVPAELARICERCLAKSPRERYRTAAALATALGTRLEGPLSSERAAVAARSGEVDVVEGPVNRAGPPPVAILVGGLALVAGVIGGAWRAGRGTPPTESPPGASSAPTVQGSTIWAEVLPQPLHPQRAVALPGRAYVPVSLREGSLAGMRGGEQPSTADTFCRRAQVRIAAGETAGALEDVEQALALDAWHRDALSVAAGLHWELGQGEAALDVLGRLLNSGLPTFQRRAHLIERAYVRLHLGRLEEAEEDARQALHDDGSQARRALTVEGLAHQILGGVYLRRGAFSAAKSELERGLQSYPDHLEGAVELLYALAGLGEESGAEARQRLESLRASGRVGPASLDDLRGRLGEVGDAARKLDAAGLERP